MFFVSCTYRRRTPARVLIRDNAEEAISIAYRFVRTGKDGRGRPCLRARVLDGCRRKILMDCAASNV